MKIGLALGSGSSRGWAHLGILQGLDELGVVPDMVCGTSIGAVVGAAYCSGFLPSLTDWALGLKRTEVLKYLTLDFSLGGMVNVDRLIEFLGKRVCPPEAEISELPRKFAAVATDLLTGKEVWLETGPVATAVRASMAYPGLFPAVRTPGPGWLVDGGLVNPVPVSLCRALGADRVIAVNLNEDIVGKHFQPTKPRTGIESLLSRFSPQDPNPTFLETLAGSVNIMQTTITRTRLVLEPPEVLLSPRLAQIGFFEIHRAGEALGEGLKSVRQAAPQILSLLES